MADLFRGDFDVQLLRPGTSLALLQMSTRLHDRASRPRLQERPVGAGHPSVLSEMTRSSHGPERSQGAG